MTTTRPPSPFKRHFCSALLALLATTSGCGPDGTPQPVPAPHPTASASALTEAPPATIIADGLATTAIDTIEQFQQFAYSDGGLLTPGRTIKFLIDNRTPERPEVLFMNSNYGGTVGKTPDFARYHYFFAKRVLPNFGESRKGFTKTTYDSQDKRYFAGSIQTYFIDGQPEPLYGIQFWPEDIIAGSNIARAVSLVRRVFRIKGAKVGFVATGAQQRIGEHASVLKNIGIKPYTLDQVLGSIDFIPLNRGEAWGYLRMFPKQPDELSATDIAVFKQLPLDLTVVAGTITKAYQDPTSHVNLKSKERGTPNMVLRSAGPKHPTLSRYVDKPVHLEVEVEGYRISLSSDEEVRGKLAKKLDKPWAKLPYVPSDQLASYAEMCPRDAGKCVELTKRYGGKASMLGFLTSAEVLGRSSDKGSLSARFGYDVAPAGFAVPFKYYQDFVDHPPNRALRKKLAELIEKEKRGVLSPRARRGLVDEVKALFYSAKFPPNMVAKVRKRLGEVLPGVDKIKVRSSANAEDMPNFDGAGLYTSFAATLSKKDKPNGVCKAVVKGVKLKMKPKTLACAMKGVFASVWNKRAIEERSFARLDHATAKMGIAIVAKYDLTAAIAANSVVITRVINTRNVFGYTFASQLKNGLVTNPKPGTLAENVIAAFTQPREAASFSITRHATPVAGGPPLDHTVMNERQLRQMLEITRHAEEQYCRFRQGYYPNDCRYAPADPDKPRALDFELKLLTNGRFICKQMREFSGR